MVYAVISVVFGLFAFIAPLPIAVPVIGLALGANGYIRETKKEPHVQQKRIKITAIAGMVACGLWVLLVLAGRLIG